VERGEETEVVIPKIGFDGNTTDTKLTFIESKHNDQTRQTTAASYIENVRTAQLTARGMILGAKVLLRHFPVQCAIKRSESIEISTASETPTTLLARKQLTLVLLTLTLLLGIFERV
jgi:hypothetical protein